MSAITLDRFVSASSRHGRLPGFRLTFGITTFVLMFVIIVPIATLLARASEGGASAAWTTLAAPRTIAAFRVSLVTAAGATLADVVIGLPVAWVLTRYDIPGRRLLDGLIDLPFALPTAVAGIALATLSAPGGWLGRVAATLGITIAYTPLGIAYALAFVGLPFVVRTAQPVMRDLPREAEEAAMVLGAGPLVIIRRLVLPAIAPAVVTGTALAFARAIGEYGSVIFIGGNRPNVSEIVPLLIIGKLEQYDDTGAAVLGAAMLGLSLLLLVAIEMLRPRSLYGG